MCDDFQSNVANIIQDKKSKGRGKSRMRAEIEALLKAYHLEAATEEQLVRDLLTMLAAGGAARRRMLDEMALAIARFAQAPRSEWDDSEIRRDLEELVRFDFRSTFRQ